MSRLSGINKHRIANSGSAVGDATVNDVVSGKRFSSDQGENLLGTYVPETAPVLTGSAQTQHVLAPQTFYNTNSGSKLTGTMQNNSGTNQQVAWSNTEADSKVELLVPAGYFDGSTKIGALDPNHVPNNIRAGVNDFGVPGNFSADGTATAGRMVSGDKAYVNGVAVIGTMPNQGGYTNPVSVAPGGNTIYARIPQGAYIQNGGAGYPEITVTDPNFTEESIANGVSMFGKVGTHVGGKRSATGTQGITEVYHSDWIWYDEEDHSAGGYYNNYYTYHLIVSGLAFTPSVVVAHVGVTTAQKAMIVAINIGGGIYSMYPSQYVSSFNTPTDTSGSTDPIATMATNNSFSSGGFNLGVQNIPRTTYNWVAYE